MQGFFSDFWGMINWCRIAGIIMLVVGLVIFFMAGRKTPPYPLRNSPFLQKVWGSA